MKEETETSRVSVLKGPVRRDSQTFLQPTKLGVSDQISYLCTTCGRQSLRRPGFNTSLTQAVDLGVIEETHTVILKWFIFRLDAMSLDQDLSVTLMASNCESLISVGQRPKSPIVGVSVSGRSRGSIWHAVGP